MISPLLIAGVLGTLMNKTLFKFYITDKKQKANRITAPEVAAGYATLHLSEKERMIRRFEYLMALEKPFILEGEMIPFVRTVANTPEIYTPNEWDSLKKDHYIHESGYKSNLCPDYRKVLEKGLIELSGKGDIYFDRAVTAILSLTDDYRKKAEKNHWKKLATALTQVPAHPARSFYEALLSLRIINFSLWVEGSYQISLGRFDQYLYPYLQHDYEAGTLTPDEAYELMAEFFLALNKDNDIYPGVQPGDNGQSLMLGGRTQTGSYLFNEVSKLALKACEELKLIDPKINIRVDKNTPLDIYVLCTRLTKVGLGFPQYCNDDVVIPGLMALGYDSKDAVEYVVAACWEFIIPNVAEDVVNVAALSFPKVIDEALHQDLLNCTDYNDFMAAVKKHLQSDTAAHCDRIKNLHFVVCPLLDGLMDYPNGKPKYLNYGMHGVGISTAVDSLTAIQQHVFEKKDVSKETLLAAVDADFNGYPELLHMLRYETEKLGSNLPASNTNLGFLTSSFGSFLNNRPNDKGGIWRAGTGSAMYYLWYADEIGASPDGRRKGEPFAANYSPSLFADLNLFSLLQSMTSVDLKQVINGGPLTLELHSSVFADDQAIEAVAMFVKRFIIAGGHQLQLNAVNADVLRDAQKHPEAYPRLIVRIWGWSAYFVELDKEFQDHVIARQEYHL